MKKTALMMILAALMFSAQVVYAADPAHPVFFQNLADVPLMPGLTEQPEAGVDFDQPSGRIVEATASSATLNKPAIVSFYDTALPQLGWTRTGAGTYTRQGEILTLTVDEKAGLRTAHIRVTPQG